MFDSYLDYVFTNFSIGACLEVLESEKGAKADWDTFSYSSEAAEADYWNEGPPDLWDYDQLCRQCETMLKMKMENLNLDEMLVAIECGDEVLEYADASTLRVYNSWKLQADLTASLGEKAKSRAVRI